MKTIELSEASGPPSKYARGALRETLVVTKRGKPLAALLSLTGVDLETLALANNPELLKILEKSRRSIKEHGGYSTAEVRRMFGIRALKRKK